MKKQYYSYQEFEKDVKRIVDKIYKDGRPVDRIYAISRGGLVLGVRLSHLLGLPLYTDSKYVSYGTIIVDEVCDTGKTLQVYKNYFTVVLHWKPKTASIEPTIWLHKTNKWISYFWEKGGVENGKHK